MPRRLLRKFAYGGLIAVAMDAALIAVGAATGTGAGTAIAALTWHWPRDKLAVEGPGPASPGALRWLTIVATGATIGTVSVLTASHTSGPGTSGLDGAVFGWMLLALLVLDVEHFWLPDRLTVPLAAMGLIAGLWWPPALIDRAIGAVAGFASLAGIAYGYRAMTGRVGLGGGDPRLFAAIGAWLGWVALPFLLLAAAGLGLVLVGFDRLSGRTVTRHTRVPLGALLAASAWPLWLIASSQGWGFGR